jgi:hypothetical protein
MTMKNRADKEQKILELREALTRLETELQKDIELEQHQAIENLDEHFNAVETKLNNLKTFWSMLKSEWRHTNA